MHSSLSNSSLPGADGTVAAQGSPAEQPVSESWLKAVLWDMDGTLVDTEPHWIDAERALVEEFGGTWQHSQAIELVGQSLWHSAGILQQAGVALGKREIIDELTRRVIGRIRLELPWRPGARELLADLRNAGVRCALVTMSEGPLAAEILAALPDGSFEFMVTGDQVEHGKPHPEPYLRAIEQLRETDPELAAAHCLALEDSVPGVTSALAAGLLTVGIPHTVPLPDDPARVTWDTLAGTTAADLMALKATAQT